MAEVADEKATQVDEAKESGPVDTGVADAKTEAADKKADKKSSASADHGVGLLYR